MITFEQVRTVTHKNAFSLSPAMAKESTFVQAAYKSGVKDAIIWDLVNNVPEAKEYFLKNYGQYF